VAKRQLTAMKYSAWRSAIAACGILALFGCGSSSSSNNSSTSQATPTSGDVTATEPPATTESTPTQNANTAIVITFDEVAVAGSAGALRTVMELKNISKDPVQCDPSEFTLQLGDATPLDADTSAAVECDPDSIDPGTTGKATIYFDIPDNYTGPATVYLTVDDNVVGQGTTQLK
jgi:archaellum component FlaG (FlaF/FlaG flagellin family)